MVHQQNILLRSQLAAAEIPPELQKYVDMDSRKKTAGAAVLLGQNGRFLFPEVLLYKSDDGKTAIRKSQLSGHGILEGLWGRRLKELKTNVLNINELKISHVCPTSIKELEEEQEEYIPGAIELIKRKVIKIPDHASASRPPTVELPVQTVESSLCQALPKQRPISDSPKGQHILVNSDTV